MSFRMFCLLSLCPAVLCAETVSYEFDIGTIQRNFTGTPVTVLAIDQQVPAPTLRAAVGDTLRVTFHNRLEVNTSVHWHGILLPGDQDGVPYLNTQPIAPGASHTFEFPILHAGTFWYHSHTDLQIQRGLYGGIVLRERDSVEVLPEQVVLFSDWTDEEPDRVLANLKKSDDFYAWKKGAVQSWDRVIANGAPALRTRLDSALSRMGPMDLADVSYDAFLANGTTSSRVPSPAAAAGQMKLRLINGSTSSYYDVEYAGGPMTVVAADGQDVMPIRVQRLRISTAETYDVLVPLAAGQSLELRATSIDGTGYSSVYIGDGEAIAAPDMPPPNLFLMGHDMDMGMDMDMEPMAMGDGMPANSGTGRGDTDATGQNPEAMPMPMPAPGGAGSTLVGEDSPPTAADAHSAHSAPPPPMPQMAPAMGAVIPHLTDYEALIAASPTTLPQGQSWRDVHLTLSGNMERYVWSFNGRTAREDPQVLIRRGENVRFHLSNDTMMHHPLHLHGHFFRVVNRHGERSPLKHTVNVPPMGQVVIEFDANESQDWLFHCHNQYHMKTGMNRVISYEESSLLTPAIAAQIQPYQRWFSLSEFHLMSSFMDYEFTLSDERHSFDFELDADLSDTYELHLFYNYHFNRFVAGFAGIESRQHHHENNHDIAVAGLNITLPLMIDSEWRLDDHGEFRLELESELQLTRQFGFDWRWNTDNEYRYGFNYRLSNRFSITVHRDTEYGDGIGVQFFY